MKFQISKSALLNAISVVAKGINNNSTTPLLSGIYLNAHDGELELQTSDAASNFKHVCAANVEEPGRSVLSGKLLLSIIKSLPDAAVSFEGSEHNVFIKCQKTNFILNALDPTDFPVFPNFEADLTVEFPRGILSSMVERVYRATSKDSSRPTLQGVLVEVQNNSVCLIATDCVRLAVCDTHIQTNELDEPLSIIIPGEALHNILSIPSNVDAIKMDVTDSKVIFTLGETVYASRKIQGTFPKYQNILPKNCTTSLKIKLNELSSALKRVTSVAQNDHVVTFEVNPEDKELKLTTNSKGNGEATESLYIEAEGNIISAKLNYRYIFECLSVINDVDEVHIEFQSQMNNTIMVIKSYSDINYLYLLMPIQW